LASAGGKEDGIGSLQANSLGAGDKTKTGAEIASSWWQDSQVPAGKNTASPLLFEAHQRLLE